MRKLPEYVVTKDHKSQRPDVLSTPSEKISFPLSPEDQEIIETLEAKFDAEENCAGLAAPQIGFHKQIIIFEARNDEHLKKWRPDLVETMPKTIWLNPAYEPVGIETHTDYEACFSVDDLAGSVARFKKIKYRAILPNGEKVDGTASGFLARIIQHEIDHIHGKLFVDYVPESELFSMEEYRKKREQEMEKEEE